MRKLVARSFAAALVVVLISGCSSTGGKKSFSWSSLNPATYFAKSDSKSDISKPKDKMPPKVTLEDASEVAYANGQSGGTAPLSPYNQKSVGTSDYRSTAGQLSSNTVSPQYGAYNPNGYTGGSLPLSPSSTDYSQYPQPSTGSAYNSLPTGTANYQPSGSGYQMQASSGYSSTPPASYSLGGGSYDIQPGSTPAYANAAAPYANNAVYGSGTVPAGSATPTYQAPFPAQGSGYESGLAQDPYRSSALPYNGASTTPDNSSSSYNPPLANPGAVNSIASLPALPPLPNQYSNTQPPYEPGKTGFNPPNVPEYTPPLNGGFVQPAAATESTYAPGSVSRYSSTPSPTTSNGYNTTGGLY